jgi:hypothetical protein
MLFIENKNSPHFKYPTAAPNAGWIVSYPLSGSAQTNPANHSRSVIRTRSGWRKPEPPTYYNTPYFAPPEGWNYRQRNICRWIAHYWKYALTVQQRSAWADFQLYAAGRPNPPRSFDGVSYKSRGWAMFFLFNKVSAQLVQPIWSTPNYLLPVPWPTPPTDWLPIQPPVNYYQDYLYVAYPGLAWPSVNLPAPNYIAGYLSRPRSCATNLHAPGLLQVWFEETTYAWQPEFQVYLYVPVSAFDFFPNTHPGMTTAVNFRLVRSDDGTPSNFLFSPQLNYTLTDWDCGIYIGPPFT